MKIQCLGFSPPKKYKIELGYLIIHLHYPFPRFWFNAPFWAISSIANLSHFSKQQRRGEQS